MINLFLQRGTGYKLLSKEKRTRQKDIILRIVLCLSLFASVELLGCSSGLSDAGDVREIVNSNNDVASPSSADEGGSVSTVDDGDSISTTDDNDTVDSEISAVVTVEEQTLIDQNDIIITAKEYVSDSFWGTAVLLYCENTSGTDVGISVDDMSINGFMITPFFSTTVYDGKKSIDDITIFSSDLEENGIIF